MTPPMTSRRRWRKTSCLDPLAITINETDEAKALWELVLYFESAEEAEAARGIGALAHGLIAPVPQQDWVRQSLEGLAPVTAGPLLPPWGA